MLRLLLSFFLFLTVTHVVAQSRYDRSVIGLYDVGVALDSVTYWKGLFYNKHPVVLKVGHSGEETNGYLWYEGGLETFSVFGRKKGDEWLIYECDSAHTPSAKIELKSGENGHYKGSWQTLNEALKAEFFVRRFSPSLGGYQVNLEPQIRSFFGKEGVGYVFYENDAISRYFLHTSISDTVSAIFCTDSEWCVDMTKDEMVQVETVFQEDGRIVIDGFRGLSTTFVEDVALRMPLEYTYEADYEETIDILLPGEDHYPVLHTHLSDRYESWREKYRQSRRSESSGRRWDRVTHVWFEPTLISNGFISGMLYIRSSLFELNHVESVLYDVRREEIVQWNELWKDHSAVIDDLKSIWKLSSLLDANLALGPAGIVYVEEDEAFGAKSMKVIDYGLLKGAWTWKARLKGIGKN